MKLLLGLLLLVSSLFSLDKIKSFESVFEQVVIDENNNKLTYSGKLFALNNNNALWRYEKPIKKSVYLTQNKVYIVEPELEQVIVKRIADDLDFLKVLEEAKEVKKDKYEAIYADNKFLIFTKEKNITDIHYTDKFDNKVEISFSQTKMNQPIKPSIFDIKVPQYYDIIKD